MLHAQSFWSELNVGQRNAILLQMLEIVEKRNMEVLNGRLLSGDKMMYMLSYQS